MPADFDSKLIHHTTFLLSFLIEILTELIVLLFIYLATIMSTLNFDDPGTDSTAISILLESQSVPDDEKLKYKTTDLLLRPLAAKHRKIIEPMLRDKSIMAKVGIGAYNDKRINGLFKYAKNQKETDSWKSYVISAKIKGKSNRKIVGYFEIGPAFDRGLKNLDYSALDLKSKKQKQTVYSMTRIIRTKYQGLGIGTALSCYVRLDPKNQFASMPLIVALVRKDNKGSSASNKKCGAVLDHNFGKKYKLLTWWLKMDQNKK